MTACTLSPYSEEAAEPGASFRGQRFSPDTSQAVHPTSSVSLPLHWLSLPAQRLAQPRGERKQLELGTRWQSQKQQRNLLAAWVLPSPLLV